MKKVISLVCGLVVLTLVSFTPVGFTADVKGTKADIETSLSKGALSFEVLNVKSQNDVDLMLNKSVPYKNEIGVAITLQKSSGLVVATLNDGAKDMRWLFRFFLNAGISHVQFEGKTTTTEVFFKPWL